MTDCSLGQLLVATTPRGVCAVRLGDDDTDLERELEEEFKAAELTREDDALAPAVATVVHLVETGHGDAELPLDVRATAFQWRVWQLLREIPAGETRSYGEIAKALGKPGAAQAVGRACGANPVAVVVPCHRVVPQGGGTGGYRWGLERKQKLLERERSASVLEERYAIEREIGAGSTACVYVAEDLKHARRVAVKVLRAELAESMEADRFVREIDIAATLQHPHIVPLFDSGVRSGLLYYVMPFVEGETLDDRLRRDGPLGCDVAVSLAAEVAMALNHAHQQGIVHRDIKPANILLSRGHALVADFGVASALDAAQNPERTQPGMAIGTPLYMSPEQAAGERDLDGRSDVYALGCVLFEMLTGQPPITGQTIREVIAKRIAATPPNLDPLTAIAPQGIRSAIQRALANAPEDRFDTAADFADALSRAPAVSR